MWCVSVDTCDLNWMMDLYLLFISFRSPFFFFFLSVCLSVYLEVTMDGGDGVVC